jgi:hypothetical protein
MIIRHREAGLVAITQPDHARLAGALVEAWRPGPDLAAAPREPLLTAAHHHDDGWLEWEEEPTLDERGLPHDFLTIPMEVRVAIYRRGINLLAAGDAFAGLLSSMHLTRLVAEGLEPLRGESRLAAEAFLAGQVAWDVRARSELGEPSGAEEAYLLLRAADFLSLLLCMRPVEELAGVSVPAIHLDPGRPADRIRLEVSAGRVLLDPYPFAEDPLEFGVSGKAIHASTFEDVESYRAALSQAPEEKLRFSLASR